MHFSAQSTTAALGLMAVACLDDTAPPTASVDTHSSAAWSEVFSGLPGGLMSVWGARSNDVWAVGSDTRDGKGPLILHYDGTSWMRRRVAPSGDLWWAHGTAGGRVYFGGSSGRIYRYEGGRFGRIPTPTTPGIVYGIWAPSEDDAWAVGGDPGSGAASFVWRLTDGRFAPVPEVAPWAGYVSAYFKVWGSSATDVWIVGSPGVVMHFDGLEFRRETVSPADPLFTVHAQGGARAAIVGGADLGVLFEQRSGAWARAELPPATRSLFGVWLTPVGGFAVGDRRTVLANHGDRWEAEPVALPGDEALHAVWTDESGGVWAAGGHVLVPPLGAGVLLHKGSPVSGTIAEGPDEAVLDGGGEDSADALPDARLDGDSGRNVCADILPDAAAGQVHCGAATCVKPAEKCCADENTGAPAGCVDASVACPTGHAPVECDGPSDCAPGWSCCLNRYLQSQALIDVKCESSCLGPSACASCADCGGAVCSPLSAMPGFQICR